MACRVLQEKRKTAALDAAERAHVVIWCVVASCVLDFCLALCCVTIEEVCSRLEDRCDCCSCDVLVIADMHGFSLDVPSLRLRCTDDLGMKPRRLLSGAGVHGPTASGSGLQAKGADSNTASCALVAGDQA